MLNDKFINHLFCEDALQFLPNLASNSIDLVLTDPPYFLNKLDNNWNTTKVSKTDNLWVIKSLPAGMKFDREQGRRFYKWYNVVSRELFRVLKPGGYFFSFSSPRLYHRMVQAMDDAGFEIRDGFIWLYTQNQPKAMSINHFIDRLDMSEPEREELKTRFHNWKTPQIKSCFEPIAMAQKPLDGTFLENMTKYEVGLMNTAVKIGDDMFPANVVSTELMNSTIDRAFLVAKPKPREKGGFNHHKTVKPLSLCEYLIKLVVFSKDGVILDPFIGSGTTAVAAQRLGVNYIGCDINAEYLDIARRRLEDEGGRGQNRMAV